MHLLCIIPNKEAKPLQHLNIFYLGGLQLKEKKTSFLPFAPVKHPGWQSEKSVGKRVAFQFSQIFTGAPQRPHKPYGASNQMPRLRNVVSKPEEWESHLLLI